MDLIRTRTPEQQRAAEERERREWEAWQRAYARYEREQMSYFRRLLAGFADVAREWLEGRR